MVHPALQCRMGRSDGAQLLFRAIAQPDGVGWTGSARGLSSTGTLACAPLLRAANTAQPRVAVLQKISTRLSGEIYGTRDLSQEIHSGPDARWRNAAHEPARTRGGI